MNMKTNSSTTFASYDELKENFFNKDIPEPTSPAKKISLTTSSSLPLKANQAAQKHSDNHPPSTPSPQKSNSTAAIMDAEGIVQLASSMGQPIAGAAQLSSPGYIAYQQASGQLFADNPLAALQNLTQPIGPALFYVAISTAALGMFCTAVTLISARRDIRDANKFNQKLHTYQEHCEQKLAALKLLLESKINPRQHAILTRDHIQTSHSLAKVRSTKTLNHRDKRGNQYTMLGALSTTAYTAPTAIAQVGLVVANPSLHSYASVGLETIPGLAAASAGIASVALSPIASVAVALGAYHMHKNAEEQRELFKQPHKKLMPMLEVREIEMSHTRKSSADIEKPYLRFLNTKLKQRIVFFRWFSRFSKGLFGGSLASATIAIAKAIALTATVAGASAALANPVVPILLVALGAVGLGITAISSQQVFYRHTKHKRYYHQRISDDPELNRAWLSTIDIWHDGYSQKGFALRARFYQMIDKREKKRQEWLMSIATRPEQPRHFEPIRYSTDTTLSTHAPVSLRKKMAAKLRADGLRTSAWTKSMLQNLSPTQAKAASRSARNAPGTMLNTDAVAAWLSDPNHRQQKIQLMRSLINDQQEFATYKLKSREEVYEQRLKLNSDLAREPQRLPLSEKYLSRPCTNNAAQEELQQLPKATTESNPATDKELHELLRQQFDADTQQNKRFKEQLDLLDTSLAQLEEQPNKHTDIQDIPSLKQLQTQFIELQHGRLWDPEKNYDATGTDKKLAHYLLRGAAVRARELRGMLVETELDAASIRYKTYGTEGDLKQERAQEFEKKLKEKALKSQAMRAFVIRQNDYEKTAQPDTASRLPSASLRRH